MARDKKIELLSQVPLFRACTDKELKRIAAIAETVQIGEGEVLTKEGAPGREFYVIAEGKASVTLRGDELAKLGSGDFFGEMALLDESPRAATVTAITPMQAYVVASQDFTTLIEDVPIVARQILKGIAQRLREMEQAPSY